MSRLATIKVEKFNSDQREMFDAITTGKRATAAGANAFVTSSGGLRGPFHPWAYSPVIGNAAQRLGECIRCEGALSDRQREIGILCAAAKWRASYEWIAHSRIARDCGVSEHLIDAILERRQPEFDDPRELVVHDVVHYVLDHGGLSDALYRHAIETFGEERLVELVVLVGYYTLVSLTLNVFEVPPPEGETSPFE